MVQCLESLHVDLDILVVYFLDGADTDAANRPATHTRRGVFVRNDWQEAGGFSCFIGYDSWRAVSPFMVNN